MRLKIIAASISALFAGAAIGWFTTGFGKCASVIADAFRALWEVGNLEF